MTLDLDIIESDILDYDPNGFYRIRYFEFGFIFQTQKILDLDIRYYEPKPERNTTYIYIICFYIF